MNTESKNDPRINKIIIDAYQQGQPIARFEHLGKVDTLSAAYRPYLVTRRLQASCDIAAEKPTGAG